MFLQSVDQPVFVVLVFDATRGGVAVAGKRLADSEKAAVRMAERLAQSRAGACAFARTSEHDEPIELARYGTVPHHLPDILGS